MEVNEFIKAVQNDDNILKGMQRIPDGTYTGKLALLNDAPVCEVEPIPGYDFKRAYVRMNLTHSESGDVQRNVEVGYNRSLLPILQEDKNWTQEFHASTSDRTSARTGNQYQIVEFKG